MAGAQFVVILFFCGLSAALVARWKGNSVLIWFLIGFGLPVIGTVAAYLYRSESGRAPARVPGLRAGGADYGAGLPDLRPGSRLSRGAASSAIRGELSRAVGPLHRRERAKTRC